MAEITLKGKIIHTVGDLPSVGEDAPNFNLTQTNMNDISLNQYRGQKVVLNIFPSIDTPVCATSVRRFNLEVSTLNNTAMLCVSRDLPFAHARFCGAEDLKNVTSVSELRSGEFGDSYGIRIIDGPLAGLFARAVVVLDEAGKVLYTQLVPEIAEEPDYQGVLSVLS
ncbi:MAG: thiol peroxidase [Candidatus Electrothrix sp. AR3]|nr:thiol peroxidase [Candidatus Electrothrix sp. AR3]